MALKNFLKQGSYLTIERIEFSKTSRYLAANIIVYNDETKKEVLLQTSVCVGGNYDAIPVSKIFTDEDALMDEAPEYIGLKKGEGYLVQINDPISDYAKHVNDLVIFRDVEETVSLISPAFIYNTVEDACYEKISERKFIKLDNYNIKTSNQFNKFVDSSNIIKSFYEVLKRMPIYSGCEDA